MLKLKNRILFDHKIRQQHQVRIISGSDEAGRGAMAGPIVVASVILPLDYENVEIKDSKLINEKQRKLLFDEIKKIALSYAIEIIPASVVDNLNPKQSSIVGMIDSIKKLSISPEISLIDGEKLNDPKINSLQLIKGDNLSQSIAAASILAKVTRDEIMKDLDQKHPGYDWTQNKGYVTVDHQERLKIHGISPEHRKSYAPVKKYL
ncbi:ribonuclease HII [Williamsoniiplasma luminosum]|uniref:Ribonuclease n=1 Tax=Williamsoniiplasma luminosum TaxID=214888 RepID=A0A2S0NJN8_9MOLU|nr:ribonuclease HII [Williamsoniiplasma luminosum]AVP49233.1 MAG: ribonuclease HII [Williamsoniiplasma luminosum]